MEHITQLIPSARVGMPYGFVVGSNPSIDGSLNLFAEGLSAPYGFLNLFVEGATYSQAGSLNLFVYNIQQVGSLNLATFGQGTQDGAYVVGGSLNLYIERWPTAALNLYCSGEQVAVTADGQQTQLTALGMEGMLYGDFTQNTRSTTGSLNMAMPYTYGIAISINGLNLYTHGF